MVTHRVIHIDSVAETLITKGDANSIADSSISWDNVVGRVIVSFPYLGKALRFSQDHKQAVLIVCGIAFAHKTKKTLDKCWIL